MILSIYGLVALNFKSYGTFCILKKLHNFLAGFLPTTEIIEPFLAARRYSVGYGQKTWSKKLKKSDIFYH